MFMHWNTVKTWILPELIYKFNIVIIKTSAELCVHVCMCVWSDKLILKHKTVPKDEERQDILE